MIEEDEEIGPREVAGLIAMSSGLTIAWATAWISMLASWEANVSIWGLAVIGLVVGYVVQLSGRLLVGDRRSYMIEGSSPGLSSEAMGTLGVFFIFLIVLLMSYGMLWELYVLSFSIGLLGTVSAVAYGFKAGLERLEIFPDDRKIFTWIGIGGLSIFWNLVAYMTFAAVASHAEWMQNSATRALYDADTSMVFEAITYVGGARRTLDWYLDEFSGTMTVMLILAVVMVAWAPSYGLDDLEQ